MHSFPVTNSTLSAVHIGLFLQSAYGLSDQTQCRLFRTGINDSYLITDGTDRYVFRVYSLHWRTELDIREEIRLLGTLHANDVPVSYGIPDANGEFLQAFSAPEGVRYGVLFSFARGGKTRIFSNQTSYMIGVAMAKFHRVTQDFALQRITYNAETLLFNPLKQVEAFFTTPSADTVFLNNSVRFLAGQFAQADTQQLRSGAVHIDLWFDNMHFFEEQEITFFDFDFCGNGWLCIDLAYFTLQLYNTEPDQKIYLEKLGHFQQGYESIAPISAEEKRLIPLLGLTLWIFYLGVQCSRFDNWSNRFLSDDYLTRFLDLIKKWCRYTNLLPDEMY